MVEEGETAVIHYTGRTIEGEGAGEVFDTSDVDIALDEGIYHGHRDYRPLEFEVGGDEVIAGIDEAVREMEPGDTKTVALEPADAFGSRSDDRVIEVPRGELEERSGHDARPWRLVRSATGEVGWITEATEETVTIDFNHDLASEPVEFEIRLLEVKESVPE